MMLLNPFHFDFWIKVSVAIICGGIIGLERQVRGKPAGIRTSILICLGTVVFVYFGTSLSDQTADPTRVLGQVVTGIGFLGAGVIMSKEGAVIGITSSAVIWMLAAIGAAIALNEIITALVLAGITVGVLVGVEALENSFKKLRQGVHRKERLRKASEDPR